MRTCTAITCSRLTLLALAAAALIAAAGCAGSGAAGRGPGTPAVTPPWSLELARLETPAGVDPALFTALKAKLAEELARLGTMRSVATPPTATSNRITDLGYYLDAEDHYILTWHYRLVGDYNLDGVVNIQDVTPIAINFLRTIAEHPEVAHVDGNESGTIDIADVTPLAINFLTQVAHYRIEGSAEQETGFTEVGSTAFADRIPDVSWPRFVHDIGDAPAYEWYRVVPLDAQMVAGIESLAVHVVPGGGGGLVLYLVSTAEGGSGTDADPYLVLLSTAYELTVEDLYGEPYTEAVVLESFPPFFIDLAEDPLSVTATSDMAGDFEVWATADEGALVSNRLYFRVQQTLP